jgi:hypothetical protein
MRKVRKTSRQLKGLTTLPTEKSLEEGWCPGSPTPTDATSGEFSPSMEFSVAESDDCCGVEGLPSIPTVGEEEKDENEYYRRTERLVFFDEEVLVRRVRPVYQIGGMIDRRELWYQDDEYKEIMWKARRLVKRAHNDDENNNEKYCLRGLEHVTNSIKRRSRSNFEGRNAVLNEQCDQFEKDVFPLDDNRISSIFIPYTKAHRVEAIERAKLDSEDVELYQQAPSSTTPVPSSSRSLNSTHSASAPQIHHMMTPKPAKRSSLKGYSSANSLSPSSPSLVNKPGMMFTYIDKQIQYPPGMKLDNI